MSGRLWCSELPYVVLLLLLLLLLQSRYRWQESLWRRELLLFGDQHRCQEDCGVVSCLMLFYYYYYYYYCNREFAGRKVYGGVSCCFLEINIDVRKIVV